MKKPLFIIAILLLSVVLIGPKFAGNTFNQGLDNYIAAVNETGVYQASIVSREQSWFSTVADIQVMLKFQGLAGGSQLPEWKINLQAQAQHGPVLTKNGIGLGWLDWAVTLVADELPPSLKILEDGPVYQALGKMGLFGGTSYQDRIAAMTYTDESTNLTASTEGWQGKGYLSSDSVIYAGGPGNMRMNLPNVYRFELNDLAVSFDAQSSITDMIKGSFYDGTALMTLKEVKIENLIDNTNSLLEQLSLSSTIDFDQDAGLADSSLEVKLATITTADFTLSDANMVMEVNNLHEPFFMAYQQMNKDIMQAPQRAQEIMQQTIQTHLLGQLQVEPELNVTKLNAVLNNGNIEFTSSNKLAGVNSLPDTMENNDFWVQHMQSTTQLNIDDNAAKFIAAIVVKQQLAGNPQIAEMDPIELEQLIAQQSEVTLDGLLQQGLFTKTENGYSMSFTLQDGKATLNNSAIPLPM